MSKSKAIVPTQIINPDEITPQMLLFVDHYIICMNGTEAARLAGYNGTDESLAVMASRLLRNVKVLTEISKRLEKYTMSANEVLIHLTDVARGDLADALNEWGGIDPLEAKRRGKSHLIKRFKHKRKTITTTTKDGENESEILEDEHEIEMYDRMDALKTLAKFHSLIADRIEVVTWEDRAVIDIKAGIIQYQDLAHEFGEDIATRLFTRAGVPTAP